MIRFSTTPRETARPHREPADRRSLDGCTTDAGRSAVRGSSDDAAADAARHSPDGSADAAARLAARRFPDDYTDAEVDELEELEEQILKLAAHLNAGTHRLLTLIAEFDRKGGWKAAGHRSCAHWLAFQTQLDLGDAREQVRVARALASLPVTSAAMAKGELSFSGVREITRVADGESEAALVEYARSSTVADLRRLIRSWRRLPRGGELERERVLHASRRFSVVPDQEGMYVVRGRLTPEVAAVLMRAVEAASDALFHPDDGVEPEQRRADALGLLAERALAAGFGESGRAGAGARCGSGLGSGAGGAGAKVVEFSAPDGVLAEGEAGETAEPCGFSAGVPSTQGISHAPMGHGSGGGAVGDAAGGVGGAADGMTGSGNTAGGGAAGGAAGAANPACCTGDRRIPLSGSRAERYQVVIHVEEEALRKDGEGGRAELEDGTRLTAETARRFACDARVVEVTRGRDGSVLDVGRRTRTVSPALRRALEVRDRGCRFPGCGLRFTEAHHIVHWSDGGETSLSNCTLQCRYHHRLLHEEGFSVRVLRGQLVFFDRDGLPIPDRPRRLEGGGDPLGALLRENLRRGVEPTYRTCMSRYRRADDIPLHVVLRAMEAVSQR